MRSVIALLSCVIALTGPLGASRNTAVFAAGDLLGSFDAIDLSGSRWTADDFRGRVVVIDFWATWCAPCLAELPRLKAMRETYGRDDLELIGVMLDPSSRHTLVSWLNRNRIDWPQIQERHGYSGALARSFGVRQLPATILVDHRGALAGVDLRGEALAARVRAAIAARRLDAGADGSRR